MGNSAEAGVARLGRVSGPAAASSNNLDFKLSSATVCAAPILSLLDFGEARRAR